MIRTTRIATVLGALVTLLSVLLVPIASAQAAPADAGGRQAHVQAAPSCPSQSLCLWHDPNFRGPRVVLTHCWDWRNIGWRTHGSFYNHQTNGTVAVFYEHFGAAGPVWHYSLAPEQNSIDWSRVGSVDPC